MLNEFYGGTELPFWVIAARLLGAALFGAVIGLEREWRAQAAGLRTHMLIAVAAASFAILTVEIVQSEYLATEQSRIDPLRVLEAVTNGVAFLAAGAIIQSRGNVKGVTTGAAMWLAGVIGLCIGTGRWSVALTALVAGAIILALLRLIEVKAGLKQPQDR